MKQVIDLSQCCGCSACASICPHKAISMVENFEGFLYPEIDETKCVNCGLCQKACPILSNNNGNFKNPDCYAAMADDETRKVSSSGGAFSIIADYILEKNGYICGCTFDENDLKAKHIVINAKEELYKLRGSKYVQSDIGTTYQDVKELLENGKFVLFSGTPCQVAGLKSFLRKEYENLLTVDILCHGVPSPKVYRKYLNELLTSSNEKVINVNFRDKVRGWSPILTHTTTTTTTTYSYVQVDDTYMQLFLNNISLRKNCTDCKFCSTQRPGDFTIADFWGIENFDKNLNDGKGTSLVLVNNPKAKNIYEKLSEKFILSKSVPLKYAILGNRNLYAPHKVHNKREEFFKDLGKYNLKQLVNKYIYDKYDCGIMNFWSTWNYGAILTCYALQEVVKNLGYSVQIINYVHNSWKNKKRYKYSEKKQRFINKYFNLTSYCKNKKELTNLNSSIDTFIVGSDQVWRWAYPLQYLFYLDYVKDDRKKIACSVSMINESFCQSDDVKTAMEYYIKRFDAISVREFDCVQYCKDKFDVNAECIIDPVFWLNPIKYQNLINNSGIKKQDKKYIAVYLIDLNNDILKLLVDYTKRNNLEIVYLNRGESIEEWLCYIKNAEFFVTDSYHGTCFSIIFETQFVAYTNNRGNSRFQSLLSMLNLTNRLYSNKDLTLTALEYANYQRIDYKKVKKILDKEICKACNWMYLALNADTNKFKVPVEIKFLNLVNKKGKVPSGLPNRIIKFKKNMIKMPRWIFSYIKYKVFIFTGNINVLKCLDTYGKRLFASKK